ncbi:MAG: hypothetical protein DRO88_10725 [Promethearchaeia archaeon]|nr:MAG: hypothetical protein DRO88_10725 [Candidatus Lokiarchaeia archaeon]
MEEIHVDVPPGIDHHCFACSQKNSVGLHLRFFSSSSPEYSNKVFSKFKVFYDFCGFPRYAHGGILATLLDEVMAHTVYRKFKRYGVTKELSLRYLKPVLIEQYIYIQGEINLEQNIDISQKKFEVQVYGKIFSSDNGVLDPNPVINVKGKAQMVILPLERYKLNYTK